MEVFALAPGDATGHDSPEYPFFKLDKSELQAYSERTGVERKMTPRLTPKSKETKDGELALAVASFIDPDTDPVMFANHLVLLGVRNHGDHAAILRTGGIGHERELYSKAMAGEIDLDPDTTVTVGSHELINERHGDPNAIWNPHPHTQVTGVMTLNSGDNTAEAELIMQLQAHKPSPGFE